MEMKERIQQKAAELFHRYGIKSITMDEIASQLGVSKKTIYQFFSDKDELVVTVARTIIEKSQSCCEHCTDSADNAVHHIANIMESLMNIFSGINPSMLYDLEKFHPKGYAVFKQYQENFLYHTILENLRQGINEGLYREDLDIEIAARLRLEGMLLGFNQQVFPASKYNVIYVQQKLLEHFLFGICSIKGHRLVLKYQKLHRKKQQGHETYLSK